MAAKLPSVGRLAKVWPLRVATSLRKIWAAPGLAITTRHWASSTSTAHDQGDFVLGHFTGRFSFWELGQKFKDILPARRYHTCATRFKKLSKLGIHHGGQAAQRGQAGQGLATQGGDIAAQNMGRAGVGDYHPPLGIEHQHPGGEVVQNGLQIGAGRLHLLHPLVYGRACFQQLLGHQGKRAGQAAHLVPGE